MNKWNLRVKSSKLTGLYLVWRYNPVNFFQEKDFKLYYDIPEDSQIEVKYFGVFEKIKNKVKEWYYEKKVIISYCTLL